MAAEIEIKIENVEYVRKNFHSAGPEIKRDLLADAMSIGRKVSSKATSMAKPSPSGLFKGARGISYPVKEIKRGRTLGARVSTPGGKVGAALAMLEFAGSAGGSYGGKKTYKTGPRKGQKIPARPHFAATLNRLYGAPGRIMWSAYDSLEPELIQTISRSITVAAQAIDRKING